MMFHTSNKDEDCLKKCKSFSFYNSSNPVTKSSALLIP